VTVNVRLQARVTGIVQGVGFRHYTRRHAASLDITGWVRNLTDGSVQLVAEGPREDLERLLERVGDGPQGSAVRRVEADWSEASGEFVHFCVRD
jgi:acylphosphatase